MGATNRCLPGTRYDVDESLHLHINNINPHTSNATVFKLYYKS